MGQVPAIEGIGGGIANVAGLRTRDHPGWIGPLARRSRPAGQVSSHQALGPTRSWWGTISRARRSPGRMSAGAPKDDLCKGFRSTSCATLSCAACQIVHRSASECLVWLTKPTAGPAGCPPHPSKANPSTNFQKFRRIGPVPTGRKKTIGRKAAHLQRQAPMNRFGSAGI